MEPSETLQPLVLKHFFKFFRRDIFRMIFFLVIFLPVT